MYHTDSSVFTSKDFMDALIEKYPHIRFSGTGATHQNGVSERGIQTVIQMDYIILIHSAILIPQGNITAELWPVAIDHVVCIYNQMFCKDSGLSAYELWSHSSFLPSKKIMSTCHTRGGNTTSTTTRRYNLT